MNRVAESGDHATRRAVDMKIYDEMPAPVRIALRDASDSYSAEQALMLMINAGEQFVVDVIADRDAKLRVKELAVYARK
jgi:hypothetical protein